MKVVSALQMPVDGESEEVYEVFSWGFDLHRRFGDGMCQYLWGHSFGLYNINLPAMLTFTREPGNCKELQRIYCLWGHRKRLHNTKLSGALLQHWSPSIRDNNQLMYRNKMLVSCCHHHVRLVVCDSQMRCLFSALESYRMFMFLHFIQHIVWISYYEYIFIHYIYIRILTNQIGAWSHQPLVYIFHIYQGRALAFATGDSRHRSLKGAQGGVPG
jgi:hypothetical protein